MPKFKLIIGLGNLGEEYDDTFHNAGFLALKFLAPKSKYKEIKGKGFEYAKGEDGIVLVRPLTYMNESGRAVREAVSYFKIDMGELLIIQDDSDIELGEYKTSFARNAAGHKGIESIIKNLGTKEFWRLRLGVRTRPGKAGAFVLRKMSKKESEKFYKSLDRSIEKVMEKIRP